MTSHLDSHRTTDIKPEMLSGVQTEMELHMIKYNIHGMAHARQNIKEDIFMQRRILQSFTYIFKWRPGIMNVYIGVAKHTRRWTYFALQYFFLSIYNNLHGPKCEMIKRPQADIVNRL